MDRWMNGWMGLSGAGRGKKAWAGGVRDGVVFIVVYRDHTHWSRAESSPASAAMPRLPKSVLFLLCLPVKLLPGLSLQLYHFMLPYLTKLT